MSVTLQSNPGQARLSRRFAETILPSFAAAVCGLLLSAGFAQAETHWNLQAVNANGVNASTGPFPNTVVGVLTTDPGEMLDATPNFVPWNGGANMFNLGAQWQIVVQAAWPGDRLGTFCYMGQNYGNMPFNGSDELSYSNEAWAAEIERLNHDPATGHAFRKGDLVAVTFNAAAFFGGKLNINETHRIDPAYDFTISLVASNYGLPAPKVLSLVSLVRTNDNDPTTFEDIFDPTRATGGEHYQGMRVRLNGLSLVTTNGWNPNNSWGDRLLSVTDGENRYFSLRHPRYSLGPVPTNKFDAIGILNQESGSGGQGTNRYELLVQEIVPSEPAGLNIALQPVITWPASLANYQLQYTNTLGGSGDWLPVTNAPVLVNGRWTVIQDSTEAQSRFYRLQRVQ